MHELFTLLSYHFLMLIEELEETNGAVITCKSNVRSV
jgi:hypothetical protein